ncbi:hypothetical protein EST38_g11909 [Candolleomyces aberdarensis]|uniref:Uncharacterized protein n=1 Tax=Candolleomyces aberdarensis TaxID=2316362 RepID=A0A4Q2D594_9AGAR|nr:hypothetical protein EST38_g11909 [Candolleomyces aberdarensis]
MLGKPADEPPAMDESTASVQGDGDKAATSSDDEDPMASSVLTVKGTAAPRPALRPIDTTGILHSQRRGASVSNPVSPLTPAPRVRTSSSARPGPSPLSGGAYRRASTLSLTSALAGVGGVVRKGVGGVVSAGAGVVGYGTSEKKTAKGPSSTSGGGLEESAFIIRSPSTPPARRPSSSSAGVTGKLPASKQHEAPAHLSPTTAPPSFTTGYTMLIYNVCYLAHTQRVVPEVKLNQAGEVLSNLWRCCCSAELGRVGHESVGWGPTPSSTFPAALSNSPLGYFGEVTSPLALAADPTSASPNMGSIGTLTMIRLPPPTPPTFPMDFGQLLQAVSGAGGAGARAKAKMRNVHTESQAAARRSEGENDDDDPWERYEEVDREDSSANRDRDKDEWDLVDGDISL